MDGTQKTWGGTIAFGPGSLRSNGTMNPVCARISDLQSRISNPVPVIGGWKLEIASFEIQNALLQIHLHPMH